MPSALEHVYAVIKCRSNTSGYAVLIAYNAFTDIYQSWHMHLNLSCVRIIVGVDDYNNAERMHSVNYMLSKYGMPSIEVSDISDSTQHLT